MRNLCNIFSLNVMPWSYFIMLLMFDCSDVFMQHIWFKGVGFCCRALIPEVPWIRWWGAPAPDGRRLQYGSCHAVSRGVNKWPAPSAPPVALPNKLSDLQLHKHTHGGSVCSLHFVLFIQFYYFIYYNLSVASIKCWCGDSRWSSGRSSLCTQLKLDGFCPHIFLPVWRVCKWCADTQFHLLSCLRGLLKGKM